MEEDIYNEVTTDNVHEDYPRSEEFSYSANECYELESYRQQRNTQYHEFQNSGLGSRAGVHPGFKKADLLVLRVTRYLIALFCMIVLLALVVIAALAFGVIQYRHSSKELTNQVNLLSTQLNQIAQKSEIKDNMISDHFDQLKNKSQKIEEELKSDINNLKLQVEHYQLDSSTQEYILQVINDLNTVKNDISLLQLQIYCGAGQWNRVAFLDMSDPSQQCPSAWRLVTTSGVRACGRPESSGSSCPETFFPTVNEYNRVCGRVIGYQNNSPDGFHLSQDNVSNVYMDGVSITVTYGGIRSHIWSYVAGLTERSSLHTLNNCPCSPAAGTGPPSFVGDNYYCESGNPTDSFRSFYSADKLWDGKQCEGTCCSGSKTPPWFSVHLPNPTTESIEVRICGDDSTGNEDTPIELLEIYVQ